MTNYKVLRDVSNMHVRVISSDVDMNALPEKLNNITLTGHSFLWSDDRCHKEHAVIEYFKRRPLYIQE